MAENILGILFVTSTSRGRNVFRYPPDPLSPYPRLSQPIYPSSTFTARDNIFGDVSRRRLFPDSTTATDPRKSSAASLPSSGKRLARAFGESSDGGSNARERYTGSRTYLPDWVEEQEEEEDELGSGTDDSDEGFYYMGSNRVPLSGKRIEEEIMNARIKDDDLAPRKADPTKTNTLSNAKAISDEKGRDNSPKLVDAGRKNAAAVAGQPHAHGVGAQATKYDASIESQYSYALGYSLDFLSDMLTPPRAACNRKFELCVDELVFIGHPVTIGSDGTWDLPKESAENGTSRRGTAGEEGERRGRRREAVGHSHLRTVVEGSGSEGTPEVEKRNPLDSSHTTGQRTETSNHSTVIGKAGKEEDECPSLDMFHMVLIIDKPDPKTAPSGGADHIAPSEGYDEVYREICFKWTAAAFALQARDNWVARESWEMAKAREKSMAEGISVEKCCISMYRTNPLERALQDLSFNLWKFRTSPVNPLYMHLPSTITIHLADLPISMVLSPKTGVTDESWAHWGSEEQGYDAASSTSSDSERDFYLGGEKKGREMRVEPWQTLLLIEAKAKERAKEVATAVVGRGSWTPTQPRPGQDEDDGNNSPVLAAMGSRRGSKETQAEEDETNLMKALIEACDVTRPLADIAHSLRFDLDGIVLPLARELVQNKKAVLIDVINQRLRTLVMPTTIVEHSTSLEEYTTSFSMGFPTLPTLPAFLSQISAAPTPFRDVIQSATSDTHPDPPTREVYLDSLIWLLKHDLVIQVHTYVRIWARVAVKEIAWKRLWLRRRARWVASRSGSQNISHTPSSAASTIGEKEEDMDLITPRASDREDPIEGLPSVPPPNGSKSHARNTSLTDSVSYANLDQSFLDYDPELEMDSDIGEAEGFPSDLDRLESMGFSLDKKEPTREDMPNFEGTFILRPARAVKEEMRWLRVIREGADEVWASKFDLCVQYFDGATSFEEISYRTGLRMREIDWIVKLFKEDVVILLHP